VSPTVLRVGHFRFFFFSREESRLHIHVQTPEGEAKFWIEPSIELTKSYRLGAKSLKQAETIISEHEQEIRDAWHRHFGS